MKPKLYLETTIFSYLAGRPSNNIILAGRQELTRQWWNERKSEYSIYISQFVIDEIERGDEEASRRRKEATIGIDLLKIDEKVTYSQKNY